MECFFAWHKKKTAEEHLILPPSLCSFRLSEVRLYRKLELFDEYPFECRDIILFVE